MKIYRISPVNFSLETITPNMFISFFPCHTELCANVIATLFFTLYYLCYVELTVYSNIIKQLTLPNRYQNTLLSKKKTVFTQSFYLVFFQLILSCLADRFAILPMNTLSYIRHCNFEGQIYFLTANGKDHSLPVLYGYTFFFPPSQ